METYRILAQSNCTTLEGVDDAEQFRGVQRAFDTIGIDADSQMQAREIPIMGAIKAVHVLCWVRCRRAGLFPRSESEY